EGKRVSSHISCCLVPGKWLYRRIVRHEALPHTEASVFKVGWPRLDDLYRIQAEYDAKPKEPRTRPKVLWAPTHDFARRGPDNVTMSSYPGFLAELPRLEKHADVFTSVHPR